MVEHDPKQGNPSADDPETITNQAGWQPLIVRHRTVWRPPTDVYELQDRLVVVMEIAGMRDGDFHIVLHDRILIVAGVRKPAVQEEQVAYHRLEIQRGEFRSEIHVPWNIQRDQVTATYHDGLLRVEIPQAKPKQIRIVNVGTDEETE